MARTRKSKQDRDMAGWEKSRGRVLEKVFSCLLLILPVILFFSYYPLIHFGSDEAMNFEISLPIIWLVVFDVVAVVMIVQRKVLLKDFRKWWMWLLFPVFLSLSVIWSLNPLRGVLTVGMLWLIYIAGYGMWRMRDLISDEFRGKWWRWWRWFFVSTLLVCVWCVVQCVLDLVGVGREQSLMCAGCTYAMFGFPHPNGFAIEPQFMGNLLLAPAIMAAWLTLKTKVTPVEDTLKAVRPSLRSPTGVTLFFLVVSATLFLTFSRGAIYAFVVGLAVMTVWVGVREKTWRVLKIWGVAVVAFVLALGAQGVMAELSPTNDTFRSGVAKVLNHLSLGVIDVRGDASGQSRENQNETNVALAEEKDETNVAGGDSDGDYEDVSTGAEGKNEAAFDGYVAESTDTRLRLSGAAVNVWQKDPTTMLLGVGLGGAGRALYDNGLSPAPKEIVQNQYASILLETGIVGVALIIVAVVLVVRLVLMSPLRVPILTLVVAYGVTLLFFSGLPNALQVYLMPMVLLAIGVSKTCKNLDFWKRK